MGKKELQSDPIMGTLGKLFDGVFIDRDDPAAAVETLHAVEERAKNGLSIVIAPEGTRVRHHRSRAVQEGAVSHRDGGGNSRSFRS